MLGICKVFCQLRLLTNIIQKYSIKTKCKRIENKDEIRGCVHFSAIIICLTQKAVFFFVKRTANVFSISTTGFMASPSIMFLHQKYSPLKILHL